MLINLTPHKIVIFVGNSQRTIPPSGKVARVETTNSTIGTVDGDIPLTKTTFDEVVGLPDPEEFDCPYCAGITPATFDCTNCWGTGTEATTYIVSRLVLEAVKDTRSDVVCPGELVRDDEGRPIGCKGLSR